MAIPVDPLILNNWDMFSDLDLLFSLQYRTTSLKRQSRPKMLTKLKKAYADQKLVLILGAGAPKNYGLPDWNELLIMLLTKSLHFAPEIKMDNPGIMARLYLSLICQSPLIVARKIQHRAGDGTFLSLEKNIRDILYKNANKIKIPLLYEEIGHLYASSKNGANLNSIITFNYDNTLEKFLAQLDTKFKCKPIYCDGMQPKDGDFPIYYVHGYLPSEDIKEELDISNKITFSEDIYHQLYTDVYSWSNIVQINKYANNTCLFIGTSLTDPNLRRLLDMAKNHRDKNLRPHFIFKKRYYQKDVKNMIINKLEEIKVRIEYEIKNKEFNKTLDANEGDNLYEDEYDNETLNPSCLKKKIELLIGNDKKLESYAKSLKKVMERLDEEDANSFGLNIIWINEHNDIPEILSNIRSFE